MSQEEFEAMLSIAIQHGVIPGGSYTLHYTGEEIDALLGSLNATPAEGVDF